MGFNFSDVLLRPWREFGYDTIFQSRCQRGKHDGKWRTVFPEVSWTDQTIVIMQHMDYVSVIDGRCPELLDIEDFFGANSDRVVIIHWNLDLDRYYHGPLRLIYFPCHSYLMIDDINDARDQWENLLKDDRQHRWMCLNGRIIDHREKVVKYLKNIPNGTISLGDEIPLDRYPYRTFLELHPKSSMANNWLRLADLYGDTDVNIVTETLYHEPGIITEKTLQAFLAGQIPIVIGYKGIVDHCERLGFDMFRDIVDTNYDYLDDDSRWIAAIESNLHLLKGPTVIDREKLKSRFIANQQWLLHYWPMELVNDYQYQVININSLIAKHADHYRARPA